MVTDIQPDSLRYRAVNRLVRLVLPDHEIINLDDPTMAQVLHVSRTLNPYMAVHFEIRPRWVGPWMLSNVDDRWRRRYGNPDDPFVMQGPSAKKD